LARGSFVVVDDRFHVFDRMVDKAVNQALFDAAHDGARVAHDKKPRGGYRTQGIQAKTVPTVPSRTAKGSKIELVDNDPRAVWFELGTLSRRRRKLSRATLTRRASVSGQARLAKTAGNPGVYGTRFLAAGIVVTKKRFVEHLARLLPG
jgi:hypothetical protein